MNATIRSEVISVVHKPLRKMSVSDRAKQFMSFSAVTGLGEAIAEVERRLSLVEKPELSEDESESVNRALNSLSVDTEAAVTHYEKGEIFVCMGKIRCIYPEFSYLCVGDERIEFENILKIDIIRKDP